MTRNLSLAAAAVALLGCGRSPGAPAPTPSARASAAPSASSAPVASASAGAPAPAGAATGLGGVLQAQASCRAIAVKGTVKAASGQALVVGTSLDRTGWLDLGPGASVAVKNTETARELVFDGPARVLPCDRGEERFVVPEGHVGTTTWAGARPGAEVLLATPFGAVRYGNAKLRVDVDAKGLTVSSDSGDAWVWAAGAAHEEKIPEGKRFENRGHPSEVKALVADCEKHAEDAETRARAVLVPAKSAAPLGVRAAEHVRARKAARASCAIAAAAVQTAKTDADKDALGRRVSYAEARWRSVPPLRSSDDPAQKDESR